MFRIKKNDQVIILAGKDKGKTGKVLEINSKDQRVLVESINTVKKAQRPTQENQKGGFINIERPIHASNVALIDKKSGKATRTGTKVLKDGSKVRISKKSGEVI